MITAWRSIRAAVRIQYGRVTDRHTDTAWSSTTSRRPVKHLNKNKINIQINCIADRLRCDAWIYVTRLVTPCNSKCTHPMVRYNASSHVPPPKKSSSSRMYLDLNQIQNSLCPHESAPALKRHRFISIGSAIFAQLTFVTNIQTHKPRWNSKSQLCTV